MNWQRFINNSYNSFVKKTRIAKLVSTTLVSHAFKHNTEFQSDRRGFESPKPGSFQKQTMKFQALIVVSSISHQTPRRTGLIHL